MKQAYVTIEYPDHTYTATVRDHRSLEAYFLQELKAKKRWVISKVTGDIWPELKALLFIFGSNPE